MDDSTLNAVESGVVLNDVIPLSQTSNTAFLSEDEPCLTLPKYIEWSTRHLTLTIVQNFKQVTKNLDLGAKSDILTKILRHRDMKHVVNKTEFPKESISMANVDNLKTSLDVVKECKVLIS